MRSMKQTFADSLAELKKVRSLTMAAMLLAIAVVLGFYTLQVTEFIKIGFAFIADELTGNTLNAENWMTSFSSELAQSGQTGQTGQT